MSQIQHQIFFERLSFMILVGIDVAKDKHDCFIQSVEGKFLHKAVSFANNYEDFEELYAKILSCNDAAVKVDFEQRTFEFRFLINLTLRLSP